MFHATKVTIHDAIQSGLPLDANELQAGLNDPEAWAQEYLCEFMDNSTVLLPYDLIETCESSLATERSSVESLSASAIPGNGRRPELFAGLDFARKNHLTVLWILERLPASALHPSLAPRREEAASPMNQSSIIHNQSLLHFSIPNSPSIHASHSASPINQSSIIPNQLTLTNLKP